MVLTHRVMGEGDPLLLLNGGLMTMANWEVFVAPLADRFCVIRCDFRGQLLTPGPFAHTLSEHAADLVELLDHLGIDAAHVAGPSFGAEVAMLLAANAPKRVKSLTVITATDRTTASMRANAREGRALAEAAAAGSGDGGELLRRIAAATYSDWWLAEQEPDFIEKRARQLAMLPPSFFAGAAAVLEPLDDLDLTDDLPRIQAPTLVVAGENDRVFPLEHSRAIAAAIHGARLEILPGTGHGALIERADRILEILLGVGALAR